MGFWDSIIGKEKTTGVPGAGKPQSINPFKVSLSFLPLRLSAHSSNSINIVVKVKNISSEPQLVSKLQEKELLIVEPKGKKRIVKLTEKGVKIANAITELMSNCSD